MTEVAYLFANGVRLARLAYEPPGDVPAINGENLHVFFELGDHLGSTSVVLDKATGELVERSTYQAYGGSESDYRPERWKSFREDYRFTGKEEDVEVGLIYFGKRFLNPLLNRWVSADPLAIHGLGADPNLYAYVSGRVLQSVDPLGLDDACGDNQSCSNDDGSEKLSSEAGDDVAPAERVCGDASSCGAWESGQQSAAPTPAPSRPKAVASEEIQDTPIRRPSAEELEDPAPLFSFFFKVPPQYYNRSVHLPPGAPNGLRELRMLNSGSKFAVADFTRDYGGTDARYLTLDVVGVAASSAEIAAGMGGAAVRGLRAATRVPQGMSQAEFSGFSSSVRAGAEHLGEDIGVHGSRAAGTAKPTSDIDVAVRVSAERFNELIKQRFGTPNAGSAKERTMQHAIKTGKIQAGEAGLGGLRKQLKAQTGMSVDISVIRKGGPFDNGSYIPLD